MKFQESAENGWNGKNGWTFHCFKKVEFEIKTDLIKSNEEEKIYYRNPRLVHK